jgi:hypothetical protein
MMFADPDPLPWPMANCAQRLRDLRSSRKLTQTRLAELLQKALLAVLDSLVNLSNISRVMAE